MLRLHPMEHADTGPAPLPCRFVKGHARAMTPSSPDLVCIDSGSTFDMSGHQADFVTHEPVHNMTISLADGSDVPVTGKGTVRLNLGGKVIEEHNWLHVPTLSMRLKSVRLHRRKHPDNYFLATNDECLLGYPTFSLDVDDGEDCVLPCSPAPPGSVPDYTDPLTQPSETPSMGHAFGSTGSRRKFTPFPHSAGSFHELRTHYGACHPSTHEVPPQYVPDSTATPQRFTNEELHKLFGNRRLLDWNDLETTCQGGKVSTLGKTPLSIGNFVNLKCGKRGKSCKPPPPGTLSAWTLVLAMEFPPVDINTV